MPADTTSGQAVDAAAVLAFAGYLLAVVAIGVRVARSSSRGLDDFFLAGRALGRFVVALSAVSSGRSSWLLLAFSGVAWQRGVSALWMAVGYIAVEAALFWSYGRRLRRLAGAVDAITLPDVYAARLGEGRGGLRVLVAGIFLLFMTPYVGAQLVAGGKTFHSLLALDTDVGIALTAGIVLVYTVLGGFLAVSLTDVVQSCFMLFSLLVLPALAVADLGGLGALRAELAALDPTLVDPVALSAGALVGFLGIGLGSPGNPHILVRYMSIRDPDALRGAAVIGTAWNVAMAGGALMIGLVGRAFYPDAALLPGGDRELVYPALAAAHLHPVLYGVVIASIFAAIMSTADSQLLVAASAVVRDVWEKLVLRRRADRAATAGEEVATGAATGAATGFAAGAATGAATGADVREAASRRLVWLSRVVIVVLVPLATAIALGGGQVVNKLVLYAWGGLGASIGPTSILMLYWRRTTRAGVAAGMLAGAGTLIAWEELGPPELYELVPGFAAGLLVTVAVSLATRAPDGAAALMEAAAPRRRRASA
jgi:SSS family solute:Na+ symporter